MMKASQVAESLGLAKRTVYELHATGKLAGYRFGSAVRFDPTDVETFRTSCRSAGTPETSAGATNLTASLKAADSGLAAYFQKAGVKPRPTPSTAKSRAASTRLQLVSSDQ
jgi:excisionase family DNA binding protein